MILDDLARFAAAVDARTLPAGVVDKARACLLYGLAVGAAGVRGAQAQQAAQAVGDAPGNATRFYDDARCGADAAAFANGTLFHVRVQDDAHPAGHVGVVVLPERYRPLALTDRKLWPHLRRTKDPADVIEQARQALREGFAGTALKLGHASVERMICAAWPVTEAVL